MTHIGEFEPKQNEGISDYGYRSLRGYRECHVMGDGAAWVLNMSQEKMASAFGNGLCCGSEAEQGKEGISLGCGMVWGVQG